MNSSYFRTLMWYPKVIPLFFYGFLGEYMLHRSRMQYTPMGCHVWDVLQFASGLILRVSSMAQFTVCFCFSGVAPAMFDASIWGLVWTEYQCYEVPPDIWAGKHWTGTVRYRACIRGRLVRANTRYDSPGNTHISFNTHIYKFLGEQTRLQNI